MITRCPLAIKTAGSSDRSDQAAGRDSGWVNPQTNQSANRSSVSNDSCDSLRISPMHGFDMTFLAVNDAAEEPTDLHTAGALRNWPENLNRSYAGPSAGSLGTTGPPYLPHSVKARGRRGSPELEKAGRPPGDRAPRHPFRRARNAEPGGVGGGSDAPCHPLWRGTPSRCPDQPLIFQLADLERIYRPIAPSRLSAEKTALRARLSSGIGYGH